jgi:hypothetical protein
MSTHATKARLGVALFFAVLSLPASVSAKTIGITPPNNPTHECKQSIDVCRAREHVGKLILPNNWARLPTRARLLVITNLERVNRGLGPVEGLIQNMDHYAQIGADHGEDPGWPSKPTTWQPLGSVEATFTGYAGASPLTADLGWMYDDGPGGENLDCSQTDHTGCWGHRDILLVRAGHCELVGGAGTDKRAASRIYTFETGCALQKPKFVFSWSKELRYFKHPPRIEPQHRASS